MVLLSRRGVVEGSEKLVQAALGAIETGRAAIPLATRMELLISARATDVVQPRLAAIPVVTAPDEVADAAGAMGAFLRTVGSPIQFPDLIVAATALWLDIDLLTWDGDYARSRALAESTGSDHPGAELWRRLALHPASLAA